MKATCTFCDKAAVVHHCEGDDTACTWLRCGACGALVDWESKRAVDRCGKPLVW